MIPDRNRHHGEQFDEFITTIVCSSFAKSRRGTRPGREATHFIVFLQESNAPIGASICPRRLQEIKT